jgi:uncharacterized membrane protein
MIVDLSLWQCSCRSSTCGVLVVRKFLGDSGFSRDTPLFLLTGQVLTTLDKVEEELKSHIGTLIRSNLTNEQEAKLRAGLDKE